MIVNKIKTLVEQISQHRLIKKYGHILLNLYLFFTLAGVCAWQSYKTYTEGNLDYVEISFIIQNLILVTVILIRKQHLVFDKNIFNQVIALVAFFSGIAFIGQPHSGGENAVAVSKIIIFVSNVLGALTLLNLGRSFGILIAYREVKTKGLYSIVRHPMYGTDILLRIGYIVSHFNLFTVVLFIVSTACYVYRAVLEERFLSKQPEYQEYMGKVRYRFIPFVY